MVDERVGVVNLIIWHSILSAEVLFAYELEYSYFFRRLRLSMKDRPATIMDTATMIIKILNMLKSHF